MLPKSTWPPSPIDELDRTMNGSTTPLDSLNLFKRDLARGGVEPATDDDLDDLVTQFEREMFAHV